MEVCQEVFTRVHQNRIPSCTSWGFISLNLNVQSHLSSWARNGCIYVFFIQFVLDTGQVK